jgi:EAL and modified HD-GYP domain-containing signal transduction protein
VLDVAILGQVALGYSAFIDRNITVSATRLTVFPLRPDAVLDVAQLLHSVGEAWPASGGRVSLNLASESLLQDLLQAEPSANLMVEVPAFMAVDPANAEALKRLADSGNALLIKGQPATELPPSLLACFKYSIIDLADERRSVELRGSMAAPAPRKISHVQAGVRTMAEMSAAFARGAHAVIGWPIDDAIDYAGSKDAKPLAPDLQVIVELINKVDSAEPIDRLEATLRRDPTLAFKLLRLINSPAFGLRVEISSFSHAIMMLGYARLKRWLALLLITATPDVNMRPLMFAAIRRGLLMEELIRGSADEEIRNEVFICGVFSLLERMFQQPFAQLFASIPVPARVSQALLDKSGPLKPYLDMVRAIESESLFDFRDAAEKLMMSVSEINRAQLRALTAASSLQ